MGNDYPAAVFSNEKAADAYVERRKKANEKHRASGGGMVYWRAYEFDLLSVYDAKEV
jgi:hypothetical protein